MTTPRPMPPRPAKGGSWRFDEAIWDYVPATPSAASALPDVSPPPDPAPADPSAAPVEDPDADGAASATVKPAKKDRK